MSHQIEKIDKEVEIIKKSQKEIRELKSTITEMKSSFRRTHLQVCIDGRLVKLKIDQWKLCRQEQRQNKKS